MEKKILVVEDDAPVRNVLEKAFRKNGYTVRSAESAEQPLEILKQEDIQVEGVSKSGTCMMAM